MKFVRLKGEGRIFCFKNDMEQLWHDSSIILSGDIIYESDPHVTKLTLHHNLEGIIPKDIVLESNGARALVNNEGSIILKFYNSGKKIILQGSYYDELQMEDELEIFIELSGNISRPFATVPIHLT